MKRRGKKKEERKKRKEGKRDGDGNRKEEVKSGCKRRILGLNHAKVTFYH
jgi:hypothetical protein